MAALPPEGATTTQYFTTGDACHQCHLQYTGADGAACVDGAGNDVSPGTLGHPTMEALAARDPFFLATFARERASRSAAATAVVDKACATCHAPTAIADAPLSGAKVDFDTITKGTGPDDNLARDGVSCTLCHQIPSDGLGTDAAFDGKITIGADHLIYGPHQNPNPSPMQFFVSYTPTFSPHMLMSEVCATCHVVRTHNVDESGGLSTNTFVEQATYFEWQNSSHLAQAETCQTCHMPRTDDAGNIIVTRLAHAPMATLQPRQPFGRHMLLGGNSYMLRVIADNAALVGTTSDAASLEATAKRTDGQLAKAASVTIASATRKGDNAVVAVKVSNLSGHKFPTGYPSRRAWLHVTATDASNGVVWESGHVDAFGRIVTRDNRLVDRDGVFEPHHDTIDRETAVQIYESVPRDANGGIAVRLLDAVSYVKDNRLLPTGWSPSHPTANMTAPAGVDGDASFGSDDVVTYTIPAGAGAMTIDVELLYQTVGPRAFEHLSSAPTDAARSFFDMAKKRTPAPVRVATAQAKL
jgi:hypothetical protein